MKQILALSRDPVVMFCMLKRNTVKLPLRQPLILAVKI